MIKYFFEKFNSIAVTLSFSSVLGIIYFYKKRQKNKLLKDQKETYPIQGIINKGTTSFLNSVLQALAGCSQIQKLIEKNIKDNNIKLEKKILKQLKTILPQLSKEGNNLNIEKLVEYLDRMYGFQNIFISQDAYDCLLFLTKIIDNSNSTINKNLNIYSQNHQINFFNEELETSDSGYQPTFYKALSVQLTSGVLKDCLNSTQKQTEETQIQKFNQSIKLENDDKFKNKNQIFKNKSFLDEDEHTQKIKKISKIKNSDQSLNISFLNDYLLIIHLDRKQQDCYGNIKKNNKFIQFTLNLNYKLKSYNLITIITNPGSDYSNIYCTYKLINKKWFCICDDGNYFYIRNSRNL